MTRLKCKSSVEAAVRARSGHGGCHADCEPGRPAAAGEAGRQNIRVRRKRHIRASPVSSHLATGQDTGLHTNKYSPRFGARRWECRRRKKSHYPGTDKGLRALPDCKTASRWESARSVLQKSLRFPIAYPQALTIKKHQSSYSVAKRSKASGANHSGYTDRNQDGRASSSLTSSRISLFISVS